MRDYRRLKVWRKAHDLTLEICRLTKGFPRHKTYGLTSQIRRSAASVGANIAEGYGHVGDGELARYLGIALSSSSELSYHLLLAKDLEYLDGGRYADVSQDLEQIQRMLVGLRMTVDRG